MSPEKTKKLYDRFPELYRGRTKPITENLMAFGFECGDGWYDIIFELSQKIDDIMKVSEMSGDDYPEAMQVKEKFGELRFYMNACNAHIVNEIDAAIRIAEEKSIKTCEKCGKPGRKTGERWIITLCETCQGENKQTTK